MVMYSPPTSEHSSHPCRGGARPPRAEAGVAGCIPCPHPACGRLTMTPTGLYGAWEHRRFWHTGAITATEWWRGGARARRAPSPAAARAATVTEYCAAHYTRIYRDLPCPYCQERPHAPPDTTGGAETSRGLSAD